MGQARAGDDAGGHARALGQFKQRQQRVRAGAGAVAGGHARTDADMADAGLHARGDRGHRARRVRRLRIGVVGLAQRRVREGLERQEVLLAGLARDLLARFPMLRVEFSALLQVPGLVQGLAFDPAGLQADAMALLDTVLADFVAAREREGGQLAAAITERADGIARIGTQVRGLVPAIRAAQRTRLEGRLAELAQPVDGGRLEQELVLALQKLDVDEELDRLDSHVLELRRVLAQDEPVGRRLDFLLQEFNREANTLGSKSVDARTSAAAVELKVLVDQVREQVQNIE